MNYSSPVNKLLKLGDCQNFEDCEKYLNLGITRDHIPELIRLATDHELIYAKGDSLEVWAPIYAWRILGQLRAEEAIEPLMKLFHEFPYYDCVSDELPIVFGKIGVKAIPALKKYLNDTSYNYHAHTRAVYSLERIANGNPSVRNECVSILTKKLKFLKSNEPELNGFIISYLLNLKAVESIKTIRRAYRKKAVDIEIPGRLEDAEYELGFHENPSERLKKYLLIMFEGTGGKYNKRVRKNDPCPCGSVQKFEQCCFRKK
ncbi:SEC-C domain-containing protein [candidate division KSB1 bacterium]|nr:SEC-C domain-containing protein [candidate division KSB1 bacterium]